MPAGAWHAMRWRATVARVGALTENRLVRLEPGRAAFNRGEYFEAHELWEEAWQVLDGVERILVQGLIQIAAGLHHLQQRRPRPAAGLLRKGLDKISRGASARSVDLHVEELAREVARLLAELNAPGARVTNPRLPKL
jgi:predicted metal-dependent hydrolase